ncbi:adenosylcobalamin-dependent ribonucleoside-diphosphate reductase [Desulfosarcina ovata]|uniref:Vitamin B12-dependent ribonucleotide reductase n=1 Tax=Desulfosarcina ovata subsp. ovata TaxID=2752305 RepID=A0A5K8AKM2_9BACT|nr:adenosylcobalamin-dependent ribonucleoside-diphosphate reductase [Desulfosarcina ovata]BBO93262.1 ribonucleotide-diphosphate reductase subunit alpha [Desulfosarcina ovata subsp. ovata]
MRTLNLTPLAREVLQKRYLARNYRGETIETPADLFDRVAWTVAEADRLFDAGAAVGETAARFESAMTSLEFLPNSPCLMNAGRPLGQLAACFVLPVEDNLESIFQSLKDAALIHRTGGGTGFSFGRLRPTGDTIFPASGVTGGPVSFIRLFDSATHLIDRNRIRPGANMGVLHVSHPDIETFITAKRDHGLLRNFNLSVSLDDHFIDCVRADRDYPLVHPRTGAIVKHRSGVALLQLMAESAWATGDPGILFIDRINRANPTPEQGLLEATNPCGEQPLLPHESCTLGSINLTRMLNGTTLDTGKLESTAHLAVHFLDNVVEVNRHPTAQTEEWSRMNRKIGLGVMGFADMLILMGIPYQSRQAVELAESIMSCIQRAAEDASAELAARRGNFPAFHRSVFPARGVKRRRNATLTTVAPTGTISILAGVSSSVEPVFAFDGQRRIAGERYTDLHPIYARYRREGRPIDKTIFQTAWDVSPHWHLKIQAAFQKYTDNAVSKTVNLPETITAEKIRDLFMDAAGMDLKGVTVYRDQSHPDQILSACSLKNEECS